MLGGGGTLTVTRGHRSDPERHETFLARISDSIDPLGESRAVQRDILTGALEFNSGGIMEFGVSSGDLKCHYKQTDFPLVHILTLWHLI